MGTFSVDRTNSGERSWWREPMMWLVVGGPLSVVVASVVTLVLVLRHPDPLVAEDYYRRGLEINKTLAHQPALQARNHAAAPAEDAAEPGR